MLECFWLDISTEEHLNCTQNLNTPVQLSHVKIRNGLSASSCHTRLFQRLEERQRSASRNREAKQRDLEEKRLQREERARRAKKKVPHSFLCRPFV